MRIASFLSGILIPFLLSAQQTQQTSGVVTNSNSHQKQIRFSTNVQAGNTPDFVDQYTLTNKSNLFITVFLPQPLTKELQKLAPDKSEAEVKDIGTYHFSFYLNNKKVYEDKMHPGAPLPNQKDSEIVWTRPLINYQAQWNIWSQYLWNRFLYRGRGDSLLTDGKHQLKIEIRAYLQNKEPIIGDVIASGELALTVARNPVIDVASISLNKPVKDAALAVSDSEYDQKKIKLLKGSIEEGIFKSITSVVVLKEGKILLEEYFNGATRATQHDTRSVGKSFASTIAGIAIGDGYLKSESQSISEFYQLKDFANYTDQKSKITIRDLLTMNSDFEGNDDDPASPGNEENMYPTSNWVQFTLGLKAKRDPAKRQWKYFTAGVVVLGDIIHQSVPGGLEKYAQAKLFGPLGITNFTWQYTPQKVANTAGGIQLRALDLARYGELYRSGGIWNGKQIIPNSWVTKSLGQQLPIPGRVNEFYGYLFWNKTYTVNGKSYETSYCAGNGGNKVFIFKNQPFVVVVTSTAYGMPYAHPQVDRIMQEFVLPAVDGDVKRQTSNE